jgi:hypothetical protein
VIGNEDDPTGAAAVYAIGALLAGAAVVIGVVLLFIGFGHPTL